MEWGDCFFFECEDGNGTGLRVEGWTRGQYLDIRARQRALSRPGAGSGRSLMPELVKLVLKYFCLFSLLTPLWVEGGMRQSAFATNMHGGGDSERGP